MKFLFCIDNDPDLKKIEKGQIKKLFDSEEHKKVEVVFKCDESPKKKLIKTLNSNKFEYDEYIVFTPCKNLLIGAIDFKEINSILQHCVSNNLDYCRLRRTTRGKIQKQLKIHADSTSLFFKCPHLIKVSALKNMVSRTLDSKRTVGLWDRMETAGFNGCFYYDSEKNETTRPDYGYFVPHIMHTLTEFVTNNGMWNNSYINYNKGHLKSLLQEYNISESKETTEYIDGKECCK